MNRAEKEIFLRGYEELCYLVREKTDNLEEYRSKIESVKAQKYSDMPFGGKTGGVDDMMVKLEALEKELEDAVEKKYTRFSNIVSAVNELENEIERVVITMRYLEFETWPEIARMINKSTRHTHRIYANAVRNMRL